MFSRKCRHIVLLLLLSVGCASRPLAAVPSDATLAVDDLSSPFVPPPGDGGTALADLLSLVDLSSPPDLSPPADFAQPPDGPTQAPSFRIDTAHTAGQPRELLTPPLKLAWSYDAGDELTYPVVANGRVFITTSSGMTTALDTQSGAVIWGPQTLGRGLLHAYDIGRLYGLTNTGLLMAIDAATGAHLWTIKMPYQVDFFSPPVAADGLVYINGLESGGDTTAIDGLSGAVVWDNHTFDGSDGRSRGRRRSGFRSRRLLAGECLVSQLGRTKVA